MSSVTPVSFRSVQLCDGFWKKRMERLLQTTLPLCLKHCEQTHRIDHFRRAAGTQPGGFEGFFFNDSDVYKVLEGAAYAGLEITAIVEDILAAQQPDGYLNTYFILHPELERWNDMGLHEDYCLGHMIEAAIAYHEATGDGRWVECAERAVKQMRSALSGRHWVTGHQELELALIRLYRHTQNGEYLSFARWLLDQRGHGYLQSSDFDQSGLDRAYCQDEVPVLEQTRAQGHAVRAMYYYTAMADYAAITGDRAMAETLRTLHDHITQHQLYITGGVGQNRWIEGFGADDSLPSLTAYCETCAAIGMAMFNQRMFLMDKQGAYADLVELEMYNGILSGISLEGDRFFYDNPLASPGNIKRKGWFSCSCCPTSLCRWIPSIPGYMYASGKPDLYINQYIASKATFVHCGNEITVTQATDYPYDGRVLLSFSRACQTKLRIPGWCKSFTVTVNGREETPEVKDGYIVLALPDGAQVQLELSMPIRIVRGNPRSAELQDRVAFARGPVVYCAESCDQRGMYPDEFFPALLRVNPSAPAALSRCPKELDGIIRIHVDGLSLIPYYAWANRTPCAMTVFLSDAAV